MGFNFQKIIEKYLDMESYGSNLIIKNYAKFPRYLPLPAHLEHGWTPKSDALVSDLDIAKEKGLMLVFNQRRKIVWQKKSKIPVEVMGAPFVLYRRMHKIKKRPDAKGTIVFPAHSTLFIESRYDIKEYCQKLKKLPSRFHPIDICLFYLDIKKGRDKIFRQRGFRVVSAGGKLRGSLNFVKNFYQIISQYQYATSNEIGSYAFYAVEMGIPFFLWGGKSKTINIGGYDPNIGRVARIKNYKYGRIASKIFDTGPAEKISRCQRNFVSKEVGLDCRCRPEKLKKTLFANTKSFYYWAVWVPIYWTLSIIKLIIPDTLSYWLLFKSKS